MDLLDFLRERLPFISRDVKTPQQNGCERKDKEMSSMEEVLACLEALKNVLVANPGMSGIIAYIFISHFRA